MKREFIYERRQSAGRMEAVMLVVSIVALIGSVFAFLDFGLIPGLELLVMTFIAFALSRLFDFIADLFISVATQNDGPKPLGAEKNRSES